MISGNFSAADDVKTLQWIDYDNLTSAKEYILVGYCVP